MNKESFKVKEKEIEPREVDSVPFLFERGSFSAIFPKGKTIVLFLDFDGTLSQIVDHPEDATISDDMKKVLKQCASQFTTAIVSGRDMDDVKKRVGINEVIYAGSHGFRISGPGGLAMEQEKMEKLLPVLDRIEEKLLSGFSDGPTGVQVERKRYAIAVHYRNADEGSVEEIKNLTGGLLEEFSGIKTGEGKKIIEIRPDVDWHKGRAVQWILDSLNLWENTEILPVYIGDDVTDEDAFRTLYHKGIGILVGTHGRPTAARYKLRNVDEVKILLQKLSGII